MAENYQVVDARKRVLMETSREEDAREYLQNHFPRHHVEPGVNVDGLHVDAKVVTPEGEEHVYHGGQWHEDVDTTHEDGRILFSVGVSAPPVKKTAPPRKAAD